MSAPNEYRQNIIDFLYSVQCCLVNELHELKKKEEIGACINERFYKLYIYYDLLQNVLKDANSCEDLQNNYCVDITQIKKLISKIKTLCKLCCVNINFEC